ncbi:hypothetical protein AAFF_G00297870 [Aldrovandia affinis]|uniref:Laminin G domain-containing protein n=1 Tax=Aldrovandia affinis TaxID=143900 RepID=A0AAD7R8R9_9TELE|nr:hypothetical protein AAFF_G00297870 [Aldrovandia affinis]
MFPLPPAPSLLNPDKRCTQGHERGIKSCWRRWAGSGRWGARCGRWRCGRAWRCGRRRRAGGLEFEGVPGQWARYERWGAASTTGELTFRMRTNASRALLLYLDDGGDCDFLELLVAAGRLRLRFAMHCGRPAAAEAVAETPVSDGRWHAVRLQRDFRRSALAVDGRPAAEAEARSKRRAMAVASDLFVGGIPPAVRLSALTSGAVRYEPPYAGAIADLRVGGAAAVLLDSHGVREEEEGGEEEEEGARRRSGPVERGTPVCTAGSAPSSRGRRSATAPSHATRGDTATGVSGLNSKTTHTLS